MAGSSLHRIVFITVGLVVMVVLHLVVAVCVLSRPRPSRRVGEHAEEEGRSSGAGGLTAEEIGELPCHEFTEGAGECAVCLDAFCPGDRCRVLPRCGHWFHAECLDSWLHKSRRCPICRTEAVERLQRKDAAGGAVAAHVEIVTLTQSQR